MARLPIDKAGFIRFAGRTFARYMEFVHRNSRVIIEPANVEAYVASLRPAIVVLWHGQFLMAPRVKPQAEPLAILLARHEDAQYFAEALEQVQHQADSWRRRRRPQEGPRRDLCAACRAESTAGRRQRRFRLGPAAGTGASCQPRHHRDGAHVRAADHSDCHGVEPLPRVQDPQPHDAQPALRHAGGRVRSAGLGAARCGRCRRSRRARLEVEANLNAATARAYELAGADPRRATPPKLPARQVRSSRARHAAQDLPRGHAHHATGRAAAARDARATGPRGCAAPAGAARRRRASRGRRAGSSGCMPPASASSTPCCRWPTRCGPSAPTSRSCSRPARSHRRHSPRSGWRRRTSTSTCRSTRARSWRASSTTGGPTSRSSPKARSGRTW